MKNEISEVIEQAFNDMKEEGVKRAKYEKQTLLDHFAGLAMHAEMIRPDGYNFDTATSIAYGCDSAYTIAEAMLAERERRMKGEK